MPTPVPDRAKCAEAARACACYNLRKASRAVSKLYDDALQPIGLRSTQFVTILAIHLNEPVGLSPLAREMVTDRSTLTRNLNVLERGGLIRSKAAGRRIRLYSLTDKGRRVLAEGIPLWEKAQGAFVDQLGAKQWSSMLSSLEFAVRAARSG
jgi:DNA-binding MarR family transcriptional regulator